MDRYDNFPAKSESMSNKLRKELESGLISTVEGKLAVLNKEATSKLKKSIKNLSKVLAKKFYKEVKRTDNKKAIPKSTTRTKTKAVVNKAPRKRGRPRKTRT
jgi:hypothetical protein